MQTTTLTENAILDSINKEEMRCLEIAETIKLATSAAQTDALIKSIRQSCVRAYSLLIEAARAERNGTLKGSEYTHSRFQQLLQRYPTHILEAVIIELEKEQPDCKFAFINITSPAQIAKGLHLLLQRGAWSQAESLIEVVDDSMNEDDHDAWELFWDTVCNALEVLDTNKKEGHISSLIRFQALRVKMVADAETHACVHRHS